jgi:signal transduction histidine kinase
LSTFVSLAPASGATYSIGSGVSLLLSFCLLEFFRRRAVTGVPSLKSSINLIFVSTIGIFTGFVSATALNLIDGGGSYFLALVLAPYISAIVIVGSAITLALSDRQEILSNLSKGAKRLTENTNHSLQSSQAASYIHNSLQSELTALAQQFELVAANPNKRQSEIVLEKLDALIRRSMGEDFSNFLESPESRLDRVLKSWDEIVTLKVNIDRLLFTDASRGMLFVQLVEESVANSVRKGNATEIAIDATFIGSRLEVQIKDNGQFNSENGAGIGTAWIERFSAGEWFITAVEGGTLLKVEL